MEPNPRSRSRRHPLLVLLGCLLASALLVGLLLVGSSALQRQQWIRKETDNRRRCADTLRALGRALTAYADANGGRYPDRFATFYHDHAATLGAPYPCCPRAWDEKRRGVNREQFVEEMDRTGFRSFSNSYRYAGAGLTVDAPADSVLIYETGHTHRDGVHALYRDGRVQWHEARSAAASDLVARFETAPARVRPEQGG